MLEDNRVRLVGALLAGLAAATLALCGASAASAEATGCRASAARLTGLGVVNLEPTVANGPGTPCASQSNTWLTLPAPLNNLLSLNAVSARTDATSGSVSAQAGVIAPLFVGVLGGISLSALTAEAHQCASGGSPSGRSEVVGLTVNGTSFGSLDKPLTIDIPSLGTLYLNRSIAGGGSVTQRAFELVLLPNLPGELAGADLILGEASVSAAGGGCGAGTSGDGAPGPPGGGEGGAGANNNGAGQPRGPGGGGSVPGAGSGVRGGTLAARQAAAALALQCSNRRLVLIDVLMRHKRVALFGAADKRLIGQRVVITFTGSHRRVASAIVGSDGLFGTTAPLPSRRLRFTNRARYQASVGRERSAPLKLTRRMIVSSISSSKGRVFIHGRVTPPWSRPMTSILVQRRISCSSSVTVKRVRPHRNGFFSAVVPAPRKAQAAVYEANTRVRAIAGSRKTYPTFTLPREVVIQ